MKPRLFSTLRCLQHENPLVSSNSSVVVILIDIDDYLGITANGKHPTNATRFARATSD